jgi:hypothetical protein
VTDATSGHPVRATVTVAPDGGAVRTLSTDVAVASSPAGCRRAR